MGSEKYPSENGFDAFLKKHGGSDNASTDCERTIFQFDIQRKNFKEALDRLGISWAFSFLVVILFFEQSSLRGGEDLQVNTRQKQEKGEYKLIWSNGDKLEQLTISNYRLKPKTHRGYKGKSMV